MKNYIAVAIVASSLTLAVGYPQEEPPGSTAAESEHHAARVENQKDRLQNGVANGSLTPQQAERLGRQDGRINREARRMAARNGGSLSESQEARIHRQMNRQSRRIYRAKHY
jgi:hypothetical protein